ncbi:histidine kinase [Streptomyces sp. ME08-AFT2]|uniref:sensor histidine kinase n=1 Tax=Streptomyces sp. ME08-AFT2 TaxID=3028683 RepID=UPI0029B085E6|nr:histidine kinase [Streptomyces sp. ME08-AFT2]MDX3312414.1 histidine kinase [Streptomyces sp. ME08-AFT2]
MTNETTVVDRVRKAARRALRPTGPAPRLTRRGRQFDLALAAAFAVTTVYYAVDVADNQVREILPGVGKAIHPAGMPAAIALSALALVTSGALVMRRRFPLAVLCAVTCLALLTPQDVARLTFYPLVVAVYSAAAYSPYRIPALVALPTAVLLVYTSGSSTTHVYPYQPGIVPNEYVVLWILGPLAMAANGLRTWRVRTDEGRARLTAVEHEQAAALRRAVAEERARIARELHDVVTHNVSVMVIQAGAARRVMRAVPDEADEALLAVEASGRAAMTDLRHVMGLLTMDGDDHAADHAADRGGELAPQPGLKQLETLVGRVRDTGLPVDLEVTGVARPVPPGIGLTAYRVVQEALTNTVKHAAGARAAVHVEYSPGLLRVEVSDTGGAPGPGAAAGNGRGLLGLRERLSVYDGTLDTGRRLTGGYRVEALIPLEAP